MPTIEIKKEIWENLSTQAKKDIKKNNKIIIKKEEKTCKRCGRLLQEHTKKEQEKCQTQNFKKKGKKWKKQK